MATLVISDLHLGARLERDVLRRPAALEALLAHLDGVDRLVLLGDTVELLEGRPQHALREALPVLSALGDALGKGSEVVLVPGNHDHALVRPWLRAQRRRGTPLATNARVAVRSSPALRAMVQALRPARTTVHYPGVWLEDGIWAHHGHYLDRHLARPHVLPADRARPDDYERAVGTSIAAFSALMAATLPTPLGEPLDRVAGLARQASVLALPIAMRLPTAGMLAPLSAGVLGFQFRRAGLPAMAAVVSRLHVRARHVLFGHVHRAGPRFGDDEAQWRAGDARLWNSGCWVYEPLLLAGAAPPHPYWPGGALRIDGGEVSELGVLDGVHPKLLR